MKKPGPGAVTLPDHGQAAPPIRSGLVHREIRTRDRILKILALGQSPAGVPPLGFGAPRLPVYRSGDHSRVAHQREPDVCEVVNECEIAAAASPCDVVRDSH
jgi:hypothetical protein